jgi:hypothetical protein
LPYSRSVAEMSTSRTPSNEPPYLDACHVVFYTVKRGWWRYEQISFRAVHSKQCLTIGHLLIPVWSGNTLSVRTYFKHAELIWTRQMIIRVSVYWWSHTFLQHVRYSYVYGKFSLHVSTNCFVHICWWSNKCPKVVIFESFTFKLPLINICKCLSHGRRPIPSSRRSASSFIHAML